MKVAHLPYFCAVFLMMYLIMTVASAIFTISPDLGYRSGQAYQIIYYCTYFYIAASLLSVFVCWKGIDMRLKVSMLCYNAILIAGIGGMSVHIGSITLTEVACALILGIIVNLLFNRRDK